MLGGGITGFFKYGINNIIRKDVLNDWSKKALAKARDYW